MTPHKIQAEIIHYPGVYATNALPWTPVKKMYVAARHHVSQQMGWFDSVVLNQDVLSLAVEARSDIYAHNPVYTPASYRKATYGLWQHGHR